MTKDDKNKQNEKDDFWKEFEERHDNISITDIVLGFLAFGIIILLIYLGVL